MYKTMTHEQIKSTFNEVYNSFYLKHRFLNNQKKTDKDWENMVKDAQDISNRYEGNFAKSIILAMLEEFEQEAKDIDARPVV